MARELTQTITYNIDGKDKGFKKALNGAQGDAKKFGGFMGKFSIGVAGAVAGAFAVDKIIGFGSALFEQGQQLEAMGIKAETVFGDFTGAVEDWADDTAAAMGLTNEQLVGLAANMGDLLKPMGFNTREAANMSREMVELSGALSAWSGGTIDAAGASEILSKAILGERDSLVSLGIKISQAEVDNRALADSGKEATSELTELDRAIATQALILEKSADAQTAWNSGAFEGIQKTNELKAKFAEFKEELANRLLPVMNDVVAFVTDDFLPAFESDVLPILVGIKDAFVGFVDSVGEKLEERGFSGQLGELNTELERTGSILTELKVQMDDSGVLDFFGGLVAIEIDLLTDRLTSFLSIFNNLLETITNAGEPMEQLKALSRAILDFADIIGNTFRVKDISDTMQRWYEAAIAWVGQFIDNAIAGLQSLVNFIISIPAKIRDAFRIGGRSLIPGFAGGVTNFGGGLALVGEKGPELVNLPRGSDVIPNGPSMRMLGQGSGGGVTVVVNVHGDVLTERRVTDVVNDALRRGNLIA